MEYYKKTIEIPEGYEIDIEETKKQEGLIVLRTQLSPTNWEELTRVYKDKASFLYSSCFDEVIEGNFESHIGLGEFVDKETACAFVALWKLLNYRKAWIGGWKPDWKNSDPKFTIIIGGDRIIVGENKIVSRSMSFPTEEMCNVFCESFKDLLEVAKPLL